MNSCIIYIYIYIYIYTVCVAQYDNGLEMQVGNAPSRFSNPVQTNNRYYTIIFNIIL